MEGITDLDILFHPQQRDRVHQVLVQTGFKHFKSVRHANYQGIENYFGMDSETTQIVHVHAHFQLTLGERLLKGYHLPWESLVLSTRRFNDDFGIYVADPNVELVLLLTREALKFRARDFVRILAGRPWMSENSQREFAWLLARIERRRIVLILRELGAEKVTDLYLSMLTPDHRPGLLVRFISNIRKFVRPYRLYRPVHALVLRIGRELRARSLVLLQRFKKTFPLPVPVRRERPDGGLVIAFIGTDGAGKSTAVSACANWLHKFDVLNLYLGSGDGPSSFLRGFLKRSRRLVTRGNFRQDAVVAGERRWVDGSVAAIKTVASDLIRVFSAILLVLERKRKLKIAWKARERGMLVITDRFPQSQVAGTNDGPILFGDGYPKCRLFQWIARWEVRQYRHISNTYFPDVVVRLKVSPEVAALRRPEMSYEQLQRKYDSLMTVHWPCSHLITIDSEGDLEEVAGNIRRAVWAVL